MSQPHTSVLITRTVATTTLAALFLGSFGCSSSNKRLTFTSTPVTSVKATDKYAYQATAAGSTNPVTYKLVTGPVGMTMTTAGLLSWTPAASAVGAHPVSISAAAGRRTGTQSWTIQVNAPAMLPSAGATDDHPVETLRVHWRDSLAASGQIPEQAKEAAERVGERERQVAITFGWARESGELDLTSQDLPDLSSWSNPQTKRSFLRMVGNFVALTRPRFLSLGDKRERTATGSAEWQLWLDVLAEARKIVEKHSPETRVFGGDEGG